MKHPKIAEIVRKMIAGQKLTGFEEILVSKSNELLLKDYLDVSSRLSTLAVPAESRSALLGAANQGQEPAELIEIEDYMPILKDLGVTMLKSIAPIKNVPVRKGNSSAALDETETATDSSDTIEKISLNPCRISHSIPVSKLLGIQGGQAAIDRIISDAVTGVGSKLLAYIFGTGARTTKRGQGIGYAITTGSGTKRDAIVPTFAEILAMEKKLSDAGAPLDSLAYVTSLKGRNILKAAAKEIGSSAAYLADESNKVNGWPCYVSNAVTNASGGDAAGALLMFANWKDLLINQVGPFVIQVDPYARARNFEVVLTVTAFFDWKGARGSETTGTTDDNEFAVSFASLAIK